jgi:hypothetical protein
MSSVVPFPPCLSSPEPAGDPRAEKISDAIKTLLSALSPEEQHRILREIAEALQPVPTPRAGEVLGTIVRWMPRDAEFTVEDAKKGVAAQRVEATPKQIFNAIGYLARKGHIRRQGYGRYLVGGVGLTTADNLGLEPTPDDDDG